ncbi:alpha/beta hydrolase [Alteromonas sp. ZYF713]|nr:alpha/beta hydrolase [Alteromonas sp. ZYF713]
MHKIIHLGLLLMLLLSAKPVLATVVVFEAGFGQTAQSWAPLLKHLPADYKVITYTRPSIAQANAKPTSIAEDVQHLISQLKPFQGEEIILVGHSYGGLIVSQVAELTPELIDGVVLLEPAVLSQRRQFKAIDSQRIAEDDKLMQQYLPAHLLAQYQLLIQQLDDAAIDTYPLPAQLPVALFTSTRRAADPLFFEETEQGKQQWLALHQALIANSEQAWHIRSLQSGHQPHKDQPALVAQAITELLSLEN